MKIFLFPAKNKSVILSLGAESAGNFSVFQNGKIYFSEDFGDLFEEENFAKFKKAVLDFLKKDKIKPDVILTDLHPLMKTTLWGEKLAKKFQATHLQVQHHHAHIFSSIGDRFIHDTSYIIPDTFYGIAMDGTGYGEDEKIWGGEVLKAKSQKSKVKSIKRIGYLENQLLLGSELAIREPARMLISILSKFLAKEEVYIFVKKYYTKNEFELLYNQLQGNFNCAETSSTGRVLDAISLLLGFCGNERKYKHEPIDLLEKNSTEPYSDLKSKIIRVGDGQFILDTSYLFNYAISALGGSASGGNYLHKKDVHRLAATAQLYIAEGLYEIVQKSKVKSQKSSNIFPIFASGGIANNKIIADYFASKNIYLNNIIPCGDAGLSFGQVVWYSLNSKK